MKKIALVLISFFVMTISGYASASDYDEGYVDILKVNNGLGVLAISISSTPTSTASTLTPYSISTGHGKLSVWVMNSNGEKASCKLSPSDNSGAAAAQLNIMLPIFDSFQSGARQSVTTYITVAGLCNGAS